MALFEAATVVLLGDGKMARFWRGRWLDGTKVENIARAAHLVKVQTVKDGIDGSWLRDYGPDLGEAALVEFFIPWQVLTEVQLSPDREDKLRCCWSADRVYSAKSAYSAFFSGRMRYTTASQIWRSRAPMDATSSRGSS
jgi:hypothetical protein